MNTTWSDYIQGIPTLYESRRLRFSDTFAPQFKALFALDAVDSAVHALPGQFSEEEIDAVKRSIHQKYDKRIAQYDGGEKEWDTTVTVIMVVRRRKQII